MELLGQGVGIYLVFKETVINYPKVAVASGVLIHFYQLGFQKKEKNDKEEGGKRRGGEKGEGKGDGDGAGERR